VERGIAVCRVADVIIGNHLHDILLRIRRKNKDSHLEELETARGTWILPIVLERRAGSGWRKISRITC
jgi:hypothetical protein